MFIIESPFHKVHLIFEIIFDIYDLHMFQVYTVIWSVMYEDIHSEAIHSEAIETKCLIIINVKLNLLYLVNS